MNKLKQVSSDGHQMSLAGRVGVGVHESQCPGGGYPCAVSSNASGNGNMGQPPDRMMDRHD